MCKVWLQSSEHSPRTLQRCSSHSTGLCPWGSSLYLVGHSCSGRIPPWGGLFWCDRVSASTDKELLLALSRHLFSWLVWVYMLCGGCFWASGNPGGLLWRSLQVLSVVLTGWEPAGLRRAVETLFIYLFLPTSIFTAETNASIVVQTCPSAVSTSCYGGLCPLWSWLSWRWFAKGRKYCFLDSGCYGFKRESLKVKVAGMNLNLCGEWVVHSKPSFRVPCVLRVTLLGELG